MLMPGTKLGPYEIVAPVGAGGMGEVYRARDTRLGRDVAIKVLPETFARDIERLSRFQREAKMLASLNHPNIATIHGFEQSNGTSYLVMELVPGETLQQQIAREGPLPLEEALGICGQIAEALEAAHEKGIIHRDLKPANVKVTPEGRVKVLDFGLAKAFAGDESSGDPSNSPTLSVAATIQGVILGTAAYMSPEQAKGKSVDKRTDIWAFGCVLYELLAGKQAFQGDTVTEILAAVLKEQPHCKALPPTTPTRVLDLLRRCLQKDKALRLRDAGDARIEIHEAQTAPPQKVEAVAPVKARWRRTAVLSLAMLALVVVTGLATWYLKPARQQTPQNPAHLAFELPPGDVVQSNAHNLALSSDGTQLAYVALRGGVPQLYLRSLDSPEVKAIEGTEGAVNPFFSPDGQWIGFFAQGKMRKIPVSGGAPLAICDAGIDAGASWGADGTIVFAPSSNSGLWRVSAAGGEPKMLTTPDHTKGEYSHRYPQILPGGKGVLFTALGGMGWDESQVEMLRFDTGERSILVRGGNTGRFVAPGFLVYDRAGDLLAVPFNLARMEVTGDTPVTVVEGIRQNNGAVSALYSVSTAGTMAYLPAAAGSLQFERRLAWVDRQGNIEPIPAPPRAYSDAELSPDGKQVAVTIISGTVQIWIYDLARGTLTPLTTQQVSNGVPVWTPDGKRVAYRSSRDGNFNLYWRPADGSGSEERLTTSDNTQTPDSWSPDGQSLAFNEVNPTAGREIWMLRLSDRKPQPFLRSAFSEGGAEFSPDGRWLAYSSNESGGNEVYVQPYPGPGKKWQVSVGGGIGPRWNPNGRELFYNDGDKIMVVDVTTSPTFSAGQPRLLYEGPGGPPSPDGKRFLTIQSVEPLRPATQIDIVLNWNEELKRLVHTGSK
ncbi:MAG: protein kinase [Candidatus Acidiferrales bacterium]